MQSADSAAGGLCSWQQGVSKACANSSKPAQSGEWQGQAAAGVCSSLRLCGSPTSPDMRSLPFSLEPSIKWLRGEEKTYGKHKWVLSELYVALSPSQNINAEPCVPKSPLTIEGSFLDCILSLRRVYREAPLLHCTAWMLCTQLGL